MSTRSLFADFRRSRGYSPEDFLTQVRLRHAREMLQHPEPGATVAAVAFACGFSDVRRFAKEYRKTFGERPSELLARSRAAGPTQH